LEDIAAEELKNSEAALNSQIIKLAEQYASCDKRSAAINDERAGIRENADRNTQYPRRTADPPARPSSRRSPEVDGDALGER